MRIRFDVPADPAYPGRVAAALTRARFHRYGYVSGVLVVLGVVGLVVSRAVDWGDRILPVCFAMVLGGSLALLYSPWLRWRARRRSSGFAVEGGYDITDDNILMRSGSESGGIAWDGVDRVVETPEFWIVYVQRRPATVIPRFYMTAEDAETLDAFIAERGLTTGPG